MSEAQAQVLLKWVRLPREVALAVFVAFAVLGTALAGALSTGGHASTDSIMQLFEAKVGRSLSWNPPFMSALLQALGASPEVGAGVAPALFVGLVCFALWGSFIALAFSGRRQEIGVMALLAIVVLVLNPALLIYAGIVWKDVLLGAVACVAVAAGMLGLSSRRASLRLVFALSCAVLVGILPLVRQQGWVIGPLLLLLPLLTAVRTPAWAPWRYVVAAFMVIVAVVSNTSIRAWAENRIPGNDGRSLSVGFMSIYAFDLAGIQARSFGNGPLVAMGASHRALDEIDAFYTPERIDFFDRAPTAKAFFASRGGELGADWRRAIAGHPGAYLRHRIAVVGALAGLHRSGACLPVHLGHDGIPQQMEALGIVQGTDVMDRHVYQMAKQLFGGPFFVHLSYLLLLAGLAVVAVFRKRGTTRLVFVLVSGVFAVFYASFLPTAIACDFRYLFAAIPAVTILGIAWVFGWSADTPSCEDKQWN